MNWKSLLRRTKEIMTGVAVLTLCAAMFSPLALAKDHSQLDTNIYQVIDSGNTNKLPKNFRTMNDTCQRNENSMLSTEGMAELHASGSGEFCEKIFQTIKDKLGNKKVIIVDLREESHLFVNGMPVTWFAAYDWINVGKTREDIEKDEQKKQEKLLAEGKATFYQVIKKGPNGTLAEVQPIELKIYNVKTEKELVTAAGLDYFRITATDHRRPQDKDVDRFVKFAKKLDNNTWLYFHCRAGRGRTTTFMVMYDMMHNAQKVSCEDIVKRQHLIGGEDLFATDGNDKVQGDCKVERILFIKNFYEYCNTNKDGFKTSWSQWIAAQR